MSEAFVDSVEKTPLVPVAVRFRNSNCIFSGAEKIFSGKEKKSVLTRPLLTNIAPKTKSLVRALYV